MKRVFLYADLSPSATSSISEVSCHRLRHDRESCRQYDKYYLKASLCQLFCLRCFAQVPFIIVLYKVIHIFLKQQYVLICI